MRLSLTTLLVAVLLVGAVSAQYHDSKYLYGGYGTTNATYASGVWLADAGNQTFQQLSPAGLKWYYAYGIKMDVDNRRVIALASGTTSTSYQVKSGIYRIDPANQTMTTVFADPEIFYGSTGPIHVNQDGDYVFATYSRVTASSVNSYHYRLMKVPSLGGAATTLLSTTNLGWTGTTTIYQGGQRDMNTGEYVVQMYNSGAGVRYGLFNLSLDGSTLSTWSTGGSYGLYSSRYDGLIQDWDSGNWMSLYGEYVYQLKPGTTSRSTLYNLGFAGPLRLYYAGKHDLRSAPNQQVMTGGYLQYTSPTTYYAPAAVAVDLSSPNYQVSYTNCDPNQTNAPQRNYPYAFDFYKGRHIQTLKVAPKQWQLLINCPRFPNKAYVAAVSFTGYKPAVKLQDGRKIYLVPDDATLLSLNGLLKPFFDGGSGQLDPQGAASGMINFSALPSLDTPMWIAVAVLDPQAPGGIAYLPDTYVFRVP